MDNRYDIIDTGKVYHSKRVTFNIVKKRSKWGQIHVWTRPYMNIQKYTEMHRIWLKIDKSVSHEKSANAILYKGRCLRTKQKVILKQMPKRKNVTLRKGMRFRHYTSVHFFSLPMTHQLVVWDVQTFKFKTLNERLQDLKIRAFQKHS